MAATPAGLLQPGTSAQEAEREKASEVKCDEEVLEFKGSKWGTDRDVVMSWEQDTGSRK